MSDIAFAAERADPTHDDHFVYMRNVSWGDYLRILREKGDHSAPRIAYLEGQLEIMSPSDTHERINSMITRLIETWCLEHDIEFTTVGSWTLKDRAVARGVEPDDCYIFGMRGKAKRPHLAIEVIWTSGSINKLEIYRKLDVSEVWIWRRGKLTAYALSGEQYEPVKKSRCLPGIDIQEIAGLLEMPTTSAAIRNYRDRLRDRRRKG
jgi:Uma2 family endonuclease